MIYSFNHSGFRDPETGVYNQTYFMEIFNREWHRHIRERQTLALLYLCPQIDETDKQAHLLELFIGQVQQALMRTSDLVARMNQDNFAVGLFNIDTQGTYTVIERIEQKIAHFNHDHQRKHTHKIDYQLAASVCQPVATLHIQQLFDDVRSLSQQLEQQKSQHAVVHQLKVQ